jgi:hypothetical protein
LGKISREKVFFIFYFPSCKPPKWDALRKERVTPFQICKSNWESASIFGQIFQKGNKRGGNFSQKGERGVTGGGAPKEFFYQILKVFPGGDLEDFSIRKEIES